MTELRTSPELLALLKVAASREQTSEEAERQRVSYIKGAVKNTDHITEARIREVLAKQ